MQKGGCYCGAVRFEVNGDLREVIYCHCTQCRKQTGHFVAATRCEDTSLKVEGEDNLTWFAASDAAKRGFCAICGASLFWKAAGNSGTSIMAGSFENPTGLKSGYHIFVGDKGDYYEICDGLPQFD